MTLQELINRRLFLSYEQEDSLIKLLSYGCSNEVKREIASKISYKFYSIFDGEEFSKNLYVKDHFIMRKDDMSIPITEIRRKVLEFK